MATFLLVRADEIATYYASVADSVGATDTDYTNEWICDARPGRPARATNGTVTWSATFSSAEVGLIAVCHCNSNVDATIGGGVTTTVTAGALQPDGIRLNGYKVVTANNQTNLTVGFSGASSAVILGEFIAGKYRTLTLPVYTSDKRSNVDFTRKQDRDLSSVPPYDPGLAGRVWECTFVLTTAEVAILEGAFLAQKNGTKPTLVVPNTDNNDAWLCFLSAPSSTPITGRHWQTSVTITEVPRVRW